MLCKSDCVSVFLNFPPRGLAQRQRNFSKNFFAVSCMNPKARTPLSPAPVQEVKGCFTRGTARTGNGGFPLPWESGPEMGRFGGRQAAVLTTQNQNLNWKRPARSWDPALRSVRTGDAAFSFNKSKSGRIGKPKGLPGHQDWGQTSETFSASPCCVLSEVRRRLQRAPL